MLGGQLQSSPLGRSASKQAARLLPALHAQHESAPNDEEGVEQQVQAPDEAGGIDVGEVDSLAVRRARTEALNEQRARDLEAKKEAAAMAKRLKEQARAEREAHAAAAVEAAADDDYEHLLSVLGQYGLRALVPALAELGVSAVPDLALVSRHEVAAAHAVRSAGPARGSAAARRAARPQQAGGGVGR